MPLNQMTLNELGSKTIPGPCVPWLSGAGADAETRLWQVQVVGGGRRAFTFQVLSAAREALLSYPDESVRNLQDLEAKKMVKLILGAPPASGPVDQNKVGVAAWNTVLYVAGPTPNAALDFIQLVVQHKVRSGALPMPPMAVQMCAGDDFDVGAPWETVSPTEATSPMPSPFLALPPRGRRHVLCQLERQVMEKEETNEESSEEHVVEVVRYIFTVFGGIYAFRGRFEEHSVRGAQVVIAPNTQEYVRMVEFSHLEEGKPSLTDILEGSLQQTPVYFINMAGTHDEARLGSPA